MLKYTFVSAIICIQVLFIEDVFAACTFDEAAIKKAVSNIETRYSDRFEERARQTEVDAVRIKDEAPRPNDAEAVLGFDIEVGSESQEIKLHIPEFTLKDQRISMHLPEVTMKQQRWRYHTPSTRMEQRCINKPPETVCRMTQRCIGGGWSRICTDIPECKLRGGGRMCTDVPVVFMQEQVTILGVPEVTMRRKDMVLGIPQVTMKLQRWRFDLPTITIKNVTAEFKKVEEQSKALQEREQNATKALSNSMQGEIKQVNVEQTQQYFSCQISDLDKQKSEIMNEFAVNLAAVNDAIASAVKHGAKDIEAAMVKAREGLLKSRNEAVKNLDDAKITMEGEMKKSVEAILNQAV